MQLSHQSTATKLLCIVFDCSSSVWLNVLPYCIVNVALMYGINWLASAKGVKIAFSIQGHSLMTLLISYLVVAKVNLCYDRYMKARYAIGNALLRLRELNQTALSYTFNGTFDKTLRIQAWRAQVTDRVLDLMDCMIRVLRSSKQARYLARMDYEEVGRNDDPMLHVQALRMHLCHGVAKEEFEFMERMKLVDTLNAFVSNYEEVLALASTPLPFPFIQMARTFLMIWTFSLPFVLRGVVEDALSAAIFVFLLTYGFIGIELVAGQLVHPFGDGKNDLNVMGMREATLMGMRRDLEFLGESLANGNDKRLEFSKFKMGPPILSPSLYHARNITERPSERHRHESPATAVVEKEYIAMEDSVV